ncbi:MAG: hypothetical protein AVDCRST_MAG41-1019 [uncultured Corynebacteriales bacterium]|uniref:Uncharacterized protein n=1 Tax=uncultured Mycobacteriales bacterium TaxID=581187 RepID=A0A6J4HUX0_9ACTN|nr:MAG: hypothetical protein AVDCRST_MAG41-1019 [uncultured Corynebacteriales bacterium]
MLVLLVWAVAVGLALVVLGILGFGLYGQLRRLRRAVAETQAELVPMVDRLRPADAPGRHRAG